MTLYEWLAAGIGVAALGFLLYGLYALYVFGHLGPGP
jgi:hypothetical protein